MLFVFISVILLLAVIFLLYDFLTPFLNWLGRIKIGQITDDEEWFEAVSSVNIDWVMKGAPKVPLDENKRFKLIYDIKGIGKTTSVSYWQDAALLKAVSADDDEASEAAEALLERYIDELAQSRNKSDKRIDSAILVYEIMSCDFIEKKSAEAAISSTAQMLERLHTEYGTIPYNVNVSDVRFVDTIGMVCPFMIKYAIDFSHTEFIGYALEQIAQYRKFGFDTEMKLPFHCFDTRNNAKLGICGWGRGCAWWALGLADSLKELIAHDGFSREKTLLLKLLMEILDEVEKYISESGAVQRMLLTDSLADSSATAMLAYCYAYTYSITKKENYRKNAERMLAYIKTVTRRNGVVDFSQGDTRGIGYYSNGLSVVPAAQGFTVAAARLIK